jgi:uncharacterized protein
MDIRFHERIAEIPEDAWNALLPPDSNPFIKYAWLSALETTGCTGGRTGWVPHHLGVYDDGALVAAMPLYVKGNSEGEFVFDYAWADAARQLGEPYYPKLVAAVPFTPATGPRLLCAPESPVRAAVAEVLMRLVEETNLSSAHLLFPRATEASEFAAQGYLLRHGIQYQFENNGYLDFEDFLKALPTKKRTQVRRERKQLAIDGVTVKTLRASELSPQVVDQMYDFYTATVDKFRWGRRYLTRAFFETLAAGPLRDDLAWVVAEQGGAAIAGAFNVKSASSLYGRYWGATKDLPFLHFNVCYYHGLDECIAHKLRSFEPGAGGEHKRVRGFLPTTTYSAHYIKNQDLRNALVSHLARERAAIAAYVASGGAEPEE